MRKVYSGSRCPRTRALFAVEPASNQPGYVHKRSPQIRLGIEEIQLPELVLTQQRTSSNPAVGRTFGLEPREIPACHHKIGKDLIAADKPPCTADFAHGDRLPSTGMRQKRTSPRGRFLQLRAASPRGRGQPLAGSPGAYGKLTRPTDQRQRRTFSIWRPVHRHADRSSPSSAVRRTESVPDSRFARKSGRTGRGRFQISVSSSRALTAATGIPVRRTSEARLLGEGVRGRSHNAYLRRLSSRNRRRWDGSSISHETSGITIAKRIRPMPIYSCTTKRTAMPTITPVIVHFTCGRSGKMDGNPLEVWRLLLTWFL
jgi:hypothetical protein